MATHTLAYLVASTALFIVAEGFVVCPNAALLSLHKVSLRSSSTVVSVSMLDEVRERGLDASDACRSILARAHLRSTSLLSTSLASW